MSLIFHLAPSCGICLVRFVYMFESQCSRCCIHRDSKICFWLGCTGPYLLRPSTQSVIHFGPLELLAASTHLLRSWRSRSPLRATAWVWHQDSCSGSGCWVRLSGTLCLRGLASLFLAYHNSLLSCSLCFCRTHSSQSSVWQTEAFHNWCTISRNNIENV